MVVTLMVGWCSGPHLTDAARTQLGSMARGAGAAIMALAVAALVGASVQVVIELVTPLPPPFHGNRPVKVGGIVLGTLAWVMMVGAIPAIAIGAVTGLAVRARCLRLIPPRTDR